MQSEQLLSKNPENPDCWLVRL